MKTFKISKLYLKYTKLGSNLTREASSIDRQFGPNRLVLVLIWHLRVSTIRKRHSWESLITITSNRYAIDGVLFDTCSNGIAAIETILGFMRSRGRSNILGKPYYKYAALDW